MTGATNWRGNMDPKKIKKLAERLANNPELLAAAIPRFGFPAFVCKKNRLAADDYLGDFCRDWRDDKHAPREGCSIGPILRYLRGGWRDGRLQEACHEAIAACCELYLQYKSVFGGASKADAYRMARKLGYIYCYSDESEDVESRIYREWDEMACDGDNLELSGLLKSIINKQALPTKPKKLSGHLRSAPPSLRFAVLERDRFTCRYCGRSAPFVKLQVDHTKAWSVGGKTVIENLVTSCWECNIGKGAKGLTVSPSEWVTELERIRKVTEA